MKFNKKYGGFTLIELMIAIMIFAVITLMSYRIISSLLKTKEVITSVHNKWGSLTGTINRMNQSVYRLIPLIVRGGSGGFLPAIQGKPKLEGKYDAQLEFTESGYIGDQIYGTNPPKRVGYRFAEGRIYLMTWPVLNFVPSTIPRVDILLENVSSFKVNFLYSDKQWRDVWPIEGSNLADIPSAMKVEIKLKSSELITRQWALSR